MCIRDRFFDFVVGAEEARLRLTQPEPSADLYCRLLARLHYRVPRKIPFGLDRPKLRATLFCEDPKIGTDQQLKPFCLGRWMPASKVAKIVRDEPFGINKGASIVNVDPCGIVLERSNRLSGAKEHFHQVRHVGSAPFWDHPACFR